jgi:membrane carboxypeptidase/penicillin-binding protein
MTRFFLQILKWALVGLVVAVAVPGALVFAYICLEYRQLPSGEAIRAYYDAPSKNSKEAPVRIKDLPRHVPLAFLAHERSDYLHTGLTLRNCAMQIIGWTKSRCADRLLQSTAQLSLRDLQPELPLDRFRLRSMLMIWKLEVTLRRQEVLEIWINKQYFGHGAYGVAEAAQSYYGKPANRLNIAQSAMLAALTRAPNIFDPVRKSQRARKRRDWILSRMFKRGMISQQELEISISTDLVPRSMP